jgi:hypothetical protein
MWGCYTRCYIAFPLFPAPRGTILTATAPAEMAVKMRREERFAGLWVPPPRAPQGRQDPRAGSGDRRRLDRLSLGPGR